MQHKLLEHLYNVGTGKDVTIKKLVETIQKITGHKGNIEWYTTKSDGTPRKLMDVTKINDLGWNANIDLKEGIESTYNWFIENNKNIIPQS